MSSTDYDQAMLKLQDLAASGMSPETQTKVYKAMAAKVSSSQDDITGEVKKLADQAVATDRTFENIRRQLTVVDQNNYKDKLGQPIAKLQPTWTKYQRRYIDLLWRSRSAATKTEAYLRDLTEVVFPLVLESDSTYEDNLKDLKAFAERPNPIQEKIQDDDFTKLQADVSAFTENFAKFADDEGAKLNTTITNLTNDINALKKELVDLNKLVEQMGIAIGVTAGAAAAGVVVAVWALGPAAPAAVVSILVAGTIAVIGEMSQLIVALVRKNTVEGDIAEKQRQIDEANKQLEILGELKSKLLLCADQSSDMFGRLANFTDIWSMASQDARSLTKSGLANVHTDKTVQAKIKLMSTTYKSLAEALRYYATLIDTSDLPAEDPQPQVQAQHAKAAHRG